jgi:hypothetical protein
LFNHSLCIQEYLVIPKPEHTKTLVLKKPRSLSVLFRALHVLTTVEFDDQFAFDRTKVGDIFTDRMLPPKFDAIEPPVTQVQPQFSFRIGLCPTEVACKSFSLGRIRQHRKPSPFPLPLGEGF